MRELVPFKGAVLTQVTAYWLQRFEDEIAHHMLSVSADEIVADTPALAPFLGAVPRADDALPPDRCLPIECVVRGYMTGSAWKGVPGHRHAGGRGAAAGPAGELAVSPPCLFPGHQGRGRARREHHGGADAGRRRRGGGRRARAAVPPLYERGRALAAERGIIIADTKFDFGRAPDGRILLIDEVMTPDSSALLAGRPVRRGAVAAELRQAATARLPRR